MLVIPFFVTSTGCILFGYGVQDTLSWVALFFGYGMISVALTAVRSPFATYISRVANVSIIDPDHHFSLRQ